MTNISGNKMMSHIERIVGDQKPITADIFITNYCNNKCPYCTYGRWELDGEAYAMKYDEFVMYAERLLRLGVEGIILTGGGEPTINPDFKKIAGWMEEKCVHYGVNTNFNKVQYIKPDYLKVSLDGWDEESYERRRGVRAYKKVRDNIARYASWKRINSPGTTLGIQIVVQEYEEIYRFYEANKDLPVDYISFRPVESTAGDYYNHEYAEKDARKSIDEIKKLREKDERVTLNFKWEMLNRHEDRCTAQWAQIAVNERGGVMYCCHKPYEVIGNIMDDDILDKKKRAATNMGRCDIPCRMTAPNMFVADIERERRDACFI